MSAPNSRSRMPIHSSPTTTRESDQGIRSTLRMSGRPAKRSWRTSAIPRPTSVASTTNATTKYSVRQKRAPVQRVLEDADVVLQADEAEERDADAEGLDRRPRRPQEVHVGEAHPQGVRQREDDDQDDRQDGGQDQEPREQRLGQARTRDRRPGHQDPAGGALGRDAQGHRDETRRSRSPAGAGPGRSDAYASDFWSFTSSLSPAGTVSCPRMMLWMIGTALTSYSPYQGSL